MNIIYKALLGEIYVKYLRNILWIVLGGGILSLLWMFIGLIWCFTVIGIPIGVKCFENALIQLNPFEYEDISEKNNKKDIMYILWLLLGGIEIFILNIICSIILLLTIVGIDLGLEYLKMARIAINPFNRKIIKKLK